MGIKFETHIKPEKETKSSLKTILNKEITLFGNAFSDKKKENFYAELSMLLKSGINLKKALELISETQRKEKDQLLIQAMADEIVTGSSLSTILEQRKSFTPYEYHAIKIGEQTGRLHDITNDLFEFFQQKNEQKRQVYAALSYPIIVMLTAIIVVYFMMQFVVPMFVDIFKQNKVELPWITEVIVDLSNMVKSYGWLLILSIIALPFGLKYLKKETWFKKPFDTLKLRIPVFGNYIKKVYLTQFIQAMALLTNSKVPVVNGIAMVREMISFYPLQDSLKQIEHKIIAGEKLSESFARFSLYDKKMIALLKVAEETNQTEYIFQKLYEQYSSDLKYRSQIITAILNPIFIFMVALIVGIILIAMYLPMFKLSSVIG
jgi:type II secretory pathway component PulF